MSRKKIEVTEEHKKQVETMAGLGLPHTQIASILSISRESLEQKFKEELLRGKAKANSKIAQTLFQNAVKGNTALLIFWAKTQMGWKEVSGLELTGKDGEPLSDAKDKLLARIPNKNNNDDEESDDQ
jgi:hypothetical protein